MSVEQQFTIGVSASLDGVITNITEGQYSVDQAEEIAKRLVTLAAAVVESANTAAAKIHAVA